MQLRQLWDEDAQEGRCVDEEVRRAVLCVETCQKVSAKGSGGLLWRHILFQENVAFLLFYTFEKAGNDKRCLMNADNCH